MATPGVAIVLSRNKPTWTEETFNKWYSGVHIKNVVKAGLSDLVIRYRNTNRSAEWPYLAVYRMVDVNDVFNPKKLARVPANDPLLPNGGPWREAIDMDLRPFGWVQTFEGKVSEDRVRGKVLRTVLIEPGNDDDLEEWYRKEHLDIISTVPGYRRSTRYKISDLENKDGLPRYLALHEYDTIPTEASNRVTSMDWYKKFLREAKSYNEDVWEEIASTDSGEAKL